MADERLSYLNNLKEDVTCEVQKTIFAASMNRGVVPHGDVCLYFVDATCFFGVDKLKIRGPYPLFGNSSSSGEMEGEMKGEMKGVFTLLERQLSIVKARVRTFSKRKVYSQLGEIVKKYESLHSTSAYRPNATHLASHFSIRPYINPEMIPSKYVVVCTIEFTPDGDFASLSTNYHFVRWYSVEYVKDNVKNYTVTTSAFDAMYTFALKDERNNAYKFPDVKETEPKEIELTEIELTAQDVWGRSD